MGNLHYLELFYYVARYRGVSRAVRHMPYGIRQPTVSVQVLQLEDQLGCSLYQRHPFQLTLAGEKLFAYIRPFFEDLDPFLAKLRGSGPKVMRLASTPLILREYMPEILEQIQPRFPEIFFTLLEGSQREIDHWFETKEVDLAISILEGKPPPGCRVLSLVKLPIVLLVPQKSPITSVQDLRHLDRFKVRLLCLPPEDPISRGLRQGLERLDVQWTAGLLVNSLELIETYVQRGHGIGVSVLAPGRKWLPGIRAVSLPNLPPLEVGVLWREPRTPAVEALLSELKKRAKNFQPL